MGDVSEVEISSKMQGEIFDAKRPFIFYIEDEESGEVLFMGAVKDPSNDLGEQAEQGLKRPFAPLPLANSTNEQASTRLIDDNANSIDVPVVESPAIDSGIGKSILNRHGARESKT